MTVNIFVGFFFGDFLRRKEGKEQGNVGDTNADDPIKKPASDDEKLPCERLQHVHCNAVRAYGLEQAYILSPHIQITTFTAYNLNKESNMRNRNQNWH